MKPRTRGLLAPTLLTAVLIWALPAVQAFAAELDVNYQRALAIPDSLIWSEIESGSCNEGIRLYREKQAAQRELLGEDHEEREDLANRMSSVLWGEVWALRRAGRYPEAVPIADSLVVVRRHAPGLRPHKIANAEELAATVRLAASLSAEDQRELGHADSLLDSLWKMKDHKAAIVAAERHLKIRRRLLGNDHPDIARTLTKLAWQQWQHGDFDSSLESRREALDITIAYWGEDHPYAADYMEHLAYVHHSLENFAQAESLRIKVIDIRTRVYGEKHRYTLYVRSLLGWLMIDQGRNKEAEALLREVLELQREVLGDSHGQLGITLVTLANLLKSMGKLAESEELYKEALDVRTRATGPESVGVAIATHGYAGLRSARGDRVTAERLYRRALELYSAAWAPDHPRIGEVMGDLAGTLLGLGRFQEAEKLLTEVIERWPESSSTLAGAYSLLAVCAAESGDERRAEELARTALDETEAALGSEHPSVASSSLTLARRMLNRGDLVSAEAVARDAVARLTAAYGRRHATTAVALQLLSSIYAARGDFVRAEGYAREAYDIHVDIYDSDHSYVANSLGWLSNVLRQSGQYELAAESNAEALAVSRRALGSEHPWIAGRLSSVAWDHIMSGDHASAVPLLREAIEISRRSTGDSSLKTAALLRGLGDALVATGDREEAESLFAECLSIERDMLGEDHPRISSTLRKLGAALYARGELEESERLLSESAKIHDLARRRVGEGMERAAFGRASPYARLALAQVEQGKWSEAWASAERTSARALADLLASAERSSLTPGETAREDSLRERMAGLERQMEAYVASAEIDSAAVSQDDIATLRESIAEAEVGWRVFRSEMSEKYPEDEGRALSLEEVQGALGPATAIVGWLDVKHPVGATESWVYVVRSSGHVEWASLSGHAVGSEGNAEATKTTRKALADPSSSRSGVRRDMRTLWRERFAPVVGALEGVRELVVIPSGPLLGIPVEALVQDDGGLLGERFEVSYSPSATIYARLGGGRLVGHTAPKSLFVGDPPFADEHLVDMANDPDSPWELLAAVDASSVDASVLRSAASGNHEALLSLPRLKGTRAEVLLLAEVGPNARVMLGADASERAILDLADAGELEQYTTIHIATHALVDDQHAEQSALVLSQIGLPDPLESAMAGERIYDGLLTAGEIVAECRLNADLVVLSACETGLGKEILGEGYVGFAQSILQAGASSLVVSLWKVDDRATALLMQRFYENRFGKYGDERGGRTAEAMPKAEALSEAKRWLKSYTDESGHTPYEHPYYWSAFVLIGDRS